MFDANTGASYTGAGCFTLILTGCVIEPASGHRVIAVIAWLKGLHRCCAHVILQFRYICQIDKGVKRKLFSDEQTLSKIGSCVSPNTRFRINSPDVVQDTIDGEAVIVNLRTGHYYSLENTGAQIWGLIEQGFGLEDTIRWICSRYEGIKEEIAQAIKDLVEELRKEELLIPLNGASSALSSSLSSQVDPGCDRKNFERPALQKYTDMQDILLLDPIHDVDESGWPHMKIDKME